MLTVRLSLVRFAHCVILRRYATRSSYIMLLKVLIKLIPVIRSLHSRLNSLRSSSFRIIAWV
uniref:Uncharacterized protein n=1 Tax=Enterobacter cloacae TaxID=550 RepID=A0A1D8REP3_ENTCL|nr:hypothetical protein [Enterobacter cloacae]